MIINNFPEMKSFAKEMVEVVFLPKAMARQLVLAVALETGMVCTLFYKYIEVVVDGIIYAHGKLLWTHFRIAFQI